MGDAPRARRPVVSAVDDDAPFAAEGAHASELRRVETWARSREPEALSVAAEYTRRFRLQVETWARRRGLWLPQGAVGAKVDDVDVTAALYEMTEETAVVRAAALAVARVSIVAQPAERTWTASVLARFRKKSASTGHEAFDEAFDVQTSDETAMRQLLDEEVRSALLEVDAWCRVTYADGAIELRLDSPRLSGAHLVRALDVVAAMARARVRTMPYR